MSDDDVVPSDAPGSGVVEELAQGVVSRILEDVSYNERGVGSWDNVVRNGLGRPSLERSGPDLYNGTLGTCLALMDYGAEFGRVSEVGFAVQGVCGAMQDDVLVGHFPNSIGFFDGAVGWAYFLLEASAAGYNVKLDVINLILQRVVHAMEANRPGCDVLSGTAGVLLFAANAWRTWEPVLPVLSALESACLAHLENVWYVRDSLRRWPERHTDIPGGFSHGAAGIGASLSAAGSELLAESAFATERILAKRRSPGSVVQGLMSAGDRAVGSWCHGFEGLRVANIWDTSSVMGLSSPADCRWEGYPLSAGLSTCHGLTGHLVVEHAVSGIPESCAHWAHFQQVIGGGESAAYTSDSLLNGRAGVLYALCRGPATKRSSNVLSLCVSDRTTRSGYGEVDGRTPLREHFR